MGVVKVVVASTIAVGLLAGSVPGAMARSEQAQDQAAADDTGAKEGVTTDLYVRIGLLYAAQAFGNLALGQFRTDRARAHPDSHRGAGPRDH